MIDSFIHVEIRMIAAAVTTSWKASILLSRHGFLACGRGWISAAMVELCGVRTSASLRLEETSHGRASARKLLHAAFRGNRDGVVTSARGTVRSADKTSHRPQPVTHTSFPVNKTKLPFLASG
ncbi:hypothetical protein GOODEAATRI_004005 [Goodea atripinnis]|uniref:Uncharacterized protein n=1 Tax=Goodea atripinnis TaxID=208336 RepID=A0ABV0P1L3_9TELE